MNPIPVNQVDQAAQQFSDAVFVATAEVVNQSLTRLFAAFAQQGISRDVLENAIEVAFEEAYEGNV